MHLCAQLGIRSLGLEIPSERSIASLMHEMDADHGGFIDEDEFVGTLRRYTRESLQQVCNFPFPLQIEALSDVFLFFIRSAHA
jgi:hypothetical protein